MRLTKLDKAATPDRVTGDFVSTMLKIKGGAGAVVTPFLKKIGLVNTDGTPTDLYRSFRNPATGGVAIATAIKKSYAALGQANEYFYKLNDKELQSLIVQVTGTEPTNSTAKQIFYSLKALMAYADFDNNATNSGIVISNSAKEQPSFTPQYKQVMRVLDESLLHDQLKSASNGRPSCFQRHFQELAGASTSP